MVLPAILEGFDMRATRWLLGMGTAFSVLSAVAAGCGSSTTGSSPAQDSGTTMDVSMMEAAVEAAPEAAMEAAPEAEAAACVPDSSIQMFNIPDANLGDGGNTEACLSCFEAACPMIVTSCNASCACVSAYGVFANCISTGAPGLSTLLACGSAFSSNSGGVITNPLSQLSCAGGCINVCGITLPTDSGSGDTGTATDSATGG
jgi:hypothetical protein